jgi:predicted ATPase
VVATQSMSLVNQFEPAEIVVTERKDRESTYRRLDAAALADWLEEHSLSDLWETNVIGGRP